jgi:hypothetical protein
VIAVPETAKAALPRTAGSTSFAAASTDRTCALTGPDSEWRNLQDIDHDLADRGDVVVGVPWAAGGTGAVDVRLTSGVSQHLTQAQLTGLPPADGGRFGASVAFIRADNDYCTDLAIGVPRTTGGEGAVVIAKGSTSGIAATGAVRLTGATPGEGFGSQVAAVGKDLFVSAPNRTVSGQTRAGAVDHYRIGDDGAVLVETITESTAGVPGVAETDDRFGEVLAPIGEGDTWADSSGAPGITPIGLAVGEPSEDVGSRADAGLVTVLSFSTSTRRLEGALSLSQDSPGVSGVAEAGDRFGASVSFGTSPGVGGLAVGVPGEDVGSAKDAGMVQTFTGVVNGTRPRQSQWFTQNSPSVPGGVEAGDRFGASVAVGRFADCVEGNSIDMAVGSPGEDLGSRHDAGTVTFLPFGTDRPSTAVCRHAWYQGSGGLGGTAESGDQLSTALAASTDLYMYIEDDPQWSHLLIGVPGEDVGTAADAGGVHDLQPPAKFPDITFGDSAGRASGARYGSVFGQSARAW